MEDRSLDEFLDAGRDEGPAGETSEAESPASDPDTDDPSNGEHSPDPSATDVDPAVSTFARTPDGDPCAACGATVERRWRGDDGLVCADCKEW